MMADRVVSWAKGGMMNQNIFVPVEMVNAMNKVKGISAQFISHLDNE